MLLLCLQKFWLFFHKSFLEGFDYSHVRALALPRECNNQKKLLGPKICCDPTKTAFHFFKTFLFFKEASRLISFHHWRSKSQGQIVLCNANCLRGFLAFASQCATKYWTGKLNRNLWRSYFSPRQSQHIFSYNLFFFRMNWEQFSLIKLAFKFESHIYKN